MTDHDPLERELRHSLAARAQEAPDADPLTERLLAVGAAGGVVDLAHRRRWRTWGTPLVAAACVAAIVGIVLAAVRPGHSDGGPHAVEPPSLPVPVSSPVRVAPSTPTGVATSSPSSTTTSTGGSTVLRDIRVLDLTFTGENSGWALGSADCLSGPGRCTALLRTSDGTHWGAFANTSPFTVAGVDGCPAATCVTHLRFADSSVGYAFGPGALYLTVDGARTWTKQAGGADALDTLDENVIRVAASGGHVSVSTAAIGSTTWTSRALPGDQGAGAAVALARTTTAAYLVSLGNAATDAPSVLWTSTDDGRKWTNRGGVCAAGSSVLDGSGVSVAPDGSVALLCRPRAGGGASVVVGSRAGKAFPVGKPLPTAAPGTPFVAAASGSTLVAGVRTLFRSTDAGTAWTARSSVDVSGGVDFAGFESASVGRLVTDGGQTVWTTRDAGRTWTRAGF